MVALSPRPVLLGVLLFAAASCAELGEPYLGAAPAVSTTAPVEGAVIDPSEADGGTGESPVIQALPARPEGYIPQLIVSTDEGPFVLDDANDAPRPLLPPPEELPEGEEPLPPIASVLAVDDLIRGFVMQEDDGSVRWYPAEAATGRLVNDLGGALFDVGYTDATPEAILLVDDRIERVRLVDGDRFVFSQLALGEDLLDLSTTGGVTLLAISDADCGELRFLDSNGERLEVGGPPRPDCPVARRPVYGTAALSPDGEAIAYTVIEYRQDGVERSTMLVAEELGSGDRLFEVSVGMSGEAVESLAFDGERAAVLKRTSAGSEVVLIEDGVAIPVDLEDLTNARSVTFARLPVTNSSESSN